MRLPTNTARTYGYIQRVGWGDYPMFDAYHSTAENGYSDNEDYQLIRCACETLDNLANHSTPWVIYIGTYGPHDPFMPSREFLSRYSLADIPLPANYHDDLRDKPNVYRRLRQQYWGQLSKTEVQDTLRHYWAYASMVDAMFGEVLDTLDRNGQSANTVVIRLSDHGEYAGAHGLFLKGVTAFREAYHIPVIIRAPMLIKNPASYGDAFINLADFAPTFYELSGLPIPTNLSGRSLLPLLRNEKPTDWRTAHHTQFNGVELYYTQRCIWNQHYKYVYNGFDFDELYDLQADPHELHNLIEQPVYEAVKHELVRQMWQFAAQQQDELIMHPYGTVALAPWGPNEALRQAD